jgi:hypothetical protein
MMTVLASVGVERPDAVAEGRRGVKGSEYVWDVWEGAEPVAAASAETSAGFEEAVVEG